jgi:hypothetical protein
MTMGVRTVGEGDLVWAVKVDRSALSAMRRGELGELGRAWGAAVSRSAVEAVGCYLTCAESDMKQPSDSLAGAS